MSWLLSVILLVFARYAIGIVTEQGRPLGRPSGVHLIPSTVLAPPSVSQPPLDLGTGSNNPPNPQVPCPIRVPCGTAASGCGSFLRTSKLVVVLWWMSFELDLGLQSWHGEWRMATHTFFGRNCTVTEVYCTVTEVFLNLTEAFRTLAEVFPCFFRSCKANARVKLAKTGRGPHSTLFGCYLCCSMSCSCVNVYCHRVTTQLQLINISYHNQQDATL
jgi:hypothetical protein